MTCFIAQNLLSEYIDGDVSPDRLRELETHLGGCQACQTELRHTRAVRSMLRQMPVEHAPVGFVDRVNERVRVGSPVRRARSWFSRLATNRWTYVGATAAVLLVAVIVNNQAGLVSLDDIISGSRSPRTMGIEGEEQKPDQVAAFADGEQENRPDEARRELTEKAVTNGDLEAELDGQARIELAVPGNVESGVTDTSVVTGGAQRDVSPKLAVRNQNAAKAKTPAGAVDKRAPKRDANRGPRAGESDSLSRQTKPTAASKLESEATAKSPPESRAAGKTREIAAETDQDERKRTRRWGLGKKNKKAEDDKLGKTARKSGGRSAVPASEPSEDAGGGAAGAASDGYGNEDVLDEVTAGEDLAAGDDDAGLAEAGAPFDSAGDATSADPGVSFSSDRDGSARRDAGKQRQKDTKPKEGSVASTRASSTAPAPPSVAQEELQDEEAEGRKPLQGVPYRVRSSQLDASSQIVELATSLGGKENLWPSGPPPLNEDGESFTVLQVELPADQLDAFKTGVEEIGTAGFQKAVPGDAETLLIRVLITYEP